MPPTVLTEGPYMSDWLKGELDNVTRYCREEALVKLGDVVAGSVIENGTVLGKLTATGKYTTLDPGSSDGTQTVAGILMFDCEVSSASDEERVTVLVRGPAGVVYDKLIWPSDIGGGRAAAEAALLALGIRGYEGA